MKEEVKEEVIIFFTYDNEQELHEHVYQLLNGDAGANVNLFRHCGSGMDDSNSSYDGANSRKEPRLERNIH